MGHPLLASYGYLRMIALIQRFTALIRAFLFFLSKKVPRVLDFYMNYEHV